MQEKVTAKSHEMLFFNTLAFTICFAAWMLNGVLVTFLVDNQVFDWGPIEIGWLLGIPVLTGALFRLPAGMLTELAAPIPGGRKGNWTLMAAVNPSCRVATIFNCIEPL